MLHQLLKDKKALVLIICCVMGFALIRNYEAMLFYDPFLEYFKNDYLNLPFPEFKVASLIWNLFLRYLLNSVLSLLILYFIFKDVELIKFVSVLYLILLVFLIVSFYFIVEILNENYNFLLFYVRRFLIQPLFLIIFIPAFYIQKNTKTA
jgi:exosortase F-associated protein